MEAYGQLLKAQGVTADALGEKLATLKVSLFHSGGKPLPGDVLSVMEELGGKNSAVLSPKKPGLEQTPPLPTLLGKVVVKPTLTLTTKRFGR